MSSAAIEIRDVEKTFTLHVQGGLRLPVLRRVSLAVAAGECVVLTDPSGAGKSTLLRAVYGNYVVQAGRILVRHANAVVDIVGALPRLVTHGRFDSHSPPNGLRKSRRHDNGEEQKGKRRTCPESMQPVTG